jgi:alkylation response protein AidB-like acyl-CoA dehydrogenase
MDFELSEQQAAFRDLMRDFARKSITPVAREWELAGRYPEEIVEEMKAMGLFGMLVPEEYGGIAIDAVSYSVVFEEISKAWMGVAGILGSHSLATLMLSKFGTPEQRARWLPDLATGKRRSGIALTEPQAGSDLQGIATVAKRDGDHYVVNGSKTWITNARHADPLPVLVKTDPNAQPRHRGMTVLMIEQGTPGFTVGKDLDKLGYKGPESSEVFLSECRVPVENVLGGEEGQGLQQSLSVLEFGRVNIAGRAVGVAQASLDHSLAYARERHAFGRPIAEFQALAHPMADLQTDIDASRLLAHRAAWMLQQGLPCSREGSMAKLKGSETYVAAARLGMQVLAGHGFSTESVMSFRYRESIVATISGGTSQIQRNGIARSMGLRTY